MEVIFFFFPVTEIKIIPI